MTRYLSLEEVLELHRLVVRQSGGSGGVRDLGGLESAVAQPRMTFDGRELYPSVPTKAAAMGFSLIRNHPFIDGNKRIGHLAMEMFLALNGHELDAGVDEQERMILGLAAGELSREEFVEWVRSRMRPVDQFGERW
ncbi:MAG: type II toxin-antitoxin system death-on-curing family toxin [Planctomycetia bacterium]|nr:type II toxin-antitoxin system death-on-curing family toxin [Planctomycetia bacterium]